MTLPESEVMTSIVSRVFRVDEVTPGNPKQGFFLRYKGSLLTDSMQAYDSLEASLRPYDITPLFRTQEGRHTILLVQGTIHPRLGRAWVNVLLFVLTVFSVLTAGAIYAANGSLTAETASPILTGIRNIWSGAPFAICLLAILSAHEFGHYFAGRAHGAAVTLPYFIPFPFSLLGTLGAFIQLKSLPKNKRALFDLAVAGPLAGLVVAVPVLIFGLATSTLGTVAAVPGGGASEGNSLLYLLSKWVVFGRLLPAPQGLTGLPLAWHWVTFFFIGQPSPVGSTDVFINQVAWAGWAGLLVTFLNLIPVGQFDGGHVVYAVFGRRVNILVPFVLVATVLLGFLWSGWWLWAFLIFLLGRTHAEPLDQITRLDAPRKAVAVLVFIVFLLVLTPIPFILLR